MTSRRTRPVRKASLRRWWISLPLLLPPFMVLFSEAWLHTQILLNHYEVNTLMQSTRAIQGRVDVLLEDRPTAACRFGAWHFRLLSAHGAPQL